MGPKPSFLKIVVCAICAFLLLYISTRAAEADDRRSRYLSRDQALKAEQDRLVEETYRRYNEFMGSPDDGIVDFESIPAPHRGGARGFIIPAPPETPPARNASAIVEQACVFIVTDKGSGSGFFVAPGYVVTNAHVVAGANGILVTNQAMRRPAYAHVVAGSRDRMRDYAVLRLDPSVCGGIRPLVFVGEPKRTEHVGAWGFPGLINETDPNYHRFMQGDFSATPVVSYTEGVVSALVGRNPTIIVHTAPISPGNSGGPLVNVNGGVVGINTANKLADRSYHQASIAISSRDLLLFLQNNGIPAQSR